LLQRVVIVAVVLALLGVGWLVLRWPSKPEMALLYSNLDPQEAARIVEKINEAAVPYELTDGGTTIKVPVEQVYSLRLQMASAGLPTGGQGGYEILDKEKIGASPFVQRINYTRALEGELAKSIKLIDGVTAVRVHVVRPQANVFTGPQQDVSATVVVRTRPGWRLSASNVAAIVNMVAGSIEGLSADNVVVVDGSGRLLAGGGEGNDIASKAGTFLDYKSQVEQYLASKAEKMLTVALGPGRASVRVSAVIDASCVDESIETYLPDNKVVIKEQIKSSSSKPGAAAKGGSGSTKEETITNEYKVSKTVKRTSELPGKITSISVAALVDLSAPSEDDSQGASGKKIMSVADVEQIIRNALGLKPTDQLKVVETTFKKSPVAELPAEEPSGWFTGAFLLELAERFSLGVLVIGALVLLRILRGAKGKAESLEESSLPAVQATAAATAGPGTQMVQNDPQLIRQQITRALQDRPEHVKQLFRQWVEPHSEG